MVKKAQKLEAVGMYRHASEFYYDGLERNSSNIDAIIGLKKTAQHVLDDKLETFFKAYSFEKDKEAVYSYIDAKAYYDRIKAIKVELDYPKHYLGYYNDIKEKYLSRRYRKGEDLIEQEKYDKAETIFKEILTIDAEYRDALMLSKVAYVEPYYQKGALAMGADRYRDAYYHLDEVVRVNKNYKDAYELRRESKEMAIFTIAIVPFKEVAMHEGVSSKINRSIMSELTDSNNPFIVIVDRQNTEKLIAEQKLALSGIVDENSAASAGLLLGVKAVLFGEVTDGNKQSSRLTKTQKTAYERYKVRRYNSHTDSYTVTYLYRKKNYTLFSDHISVSITYEYQLVSSETGEILGSGIYTETASDHIEYATYSGNTKELYPSTNSGLFSSAKKDFDKKFVARKNVKTLKQLAAEIYPKISKVITKEILEYEATRN
jgi:tetratricopeptide (TPR) repeat protein